LYESTTHCKEEDEEVTSLMVNDPCPLCFHSLVAPPPGSTDWSVVYFADYPGVDFHGTCVRKRGIVDAVAIAAIIWRRSIGYANDKEKDEGAGVLNEYIKLLWAAWHNLVWCAGSSQDIDYWGKMVNYWTDLVINHQGWAY
jgi:hypothetical protein